MAELRSPVQFYIVGLSNQTAKSSLGLEPLVTDGRLFKTQSGKIWTYKGLSAFNIISEFAQGKPIDWFLNQFPSANVLRVFWYTPRKYWGNFAWDLPKPSEILAFHRYVGDRGFYVENVCITDDNFSLVDRIKELIWALKESKLPNVLFEAVNEPFIHDKLEPSILKNALTSTPYLYSSGVNPFDFLDKFYGRYITPHLPRDFEGVRKSKDLEELSSKYRMPSVSDEWAKPNDGNFSELDFYTHAALAKLMGNGATYHFESGKIISPVSDREDTCGRMFMKGLDLYPDDASLGQYEHLRDMEEPTPDGVPTKALRVFRKGSYAIIVRNNGVKIPANWTPLDTFGVGYHIP
jgi:hypothetical protein